MRTFEKYRLPDGRIVDVDVSASKGAATIGFTLEGGAVVPAVRVQPAGIELQGFFFTFGCGSPLSRYYVLIHAEDEHQARCRMVCLFSHHWASIYPASELGEQVARFGLQRLDYYNQATVRLGTNDAAVPIDVFNRAYPWEREETHAHAV